MKSITAIIESLPDGYTKVRFKAKAYGMTVSRFNNGKSIKMYAEELGGNDFVSMNYYFGTSKNYLKPCEMPEEKVTTFLSEMNVL